MIDPVVSAAESEFWSILGVFKLIGIIVASFAIYAACSLLARRLFRMKRRFRDGFIGS